MNARKVANFLILRSAFTRRNFSSLFLVAIFFAVYVMSGGKITTQLPKIKEAGSFGGAEMPAEDADGSQGLAAKQKADEEKAREILGVKPSAERQARENASNNRNNLFDPENDEKEAPLDPKGLIQADMTNHKEESKLRKLEGRERDSLAAIEERLNIKRNK